MTSRTRRRATALVPAVGLALVVATALAGCSTPDDPAVDPGADPGASASALPSTGTTTPTSPASAIPTADPSGTGGATEPPPSSDEGAVVPGRPVETAPPKRLDETASTGGARVALRSVRATTVTADGPGDSSGPGLLVDLVLTNATARALDTGFVQVNVADDAGDPGTLVGGAPTDPLPGSVRAGREARGTYAFLLPDAAGAPVTVSVYLTSGEPVVQFRGRAS